MDRSPQPWHYHEDKMLCFTSEADSTCPWRQALLSERSLLRHTTYRKVCNFASPMPNRNHTSQTKVKMHHIFAVVMSLGASERVNYFYRLINATDYGQLSVVVLKIVIIFSFFGNLFEQKIQTKYRWLQNKYYNFSDCLPCTLFSSYDFLQSLMVPKSFSIAQWAKVTDTLVAMQYQNLGIFLANIFRLDR